MLSIYVVVDSGVEKIAEAVTLSKNAVVKFTGARAAYVFDTTIYNDYVYIWGTEYQGTGEFTWGYTGSYQYVWVCSLDSSAWNHSYSDLTNTAAYNYNADLIVNGACVSYMPD